MNWKFWKKEREAGVTAAASPARSAPGVEATRAYVDAWTPGVALSVSAAYRAVDYLSDQVAMLPIEPKRWNEAEKRFVNWTERSLWRLLTQRPDGRRTPVHTHPPE